MTDLTYLYCTIDDWYKEYKINIEGYFLPSEQSILLEIKSKLSMSEIITILTYFHMSCSRNFKTFYKKQILKSGKKDFPDAVSYTRFVELIPYSIFPMVAILKALGKKAITGISFIDSTKLQACYIRREKQNKVFKGIAKKGHSSTGWFFGFKLHLIVSDKGEIINFDITPGNTHDGNINLIANLTKNLFGKLIGDKGYISNKLFNFLFSNNIQLITKIKKNMKNKLMNIYDKFLLRKRAIIETINDQLKNICYIEHTRHRSFDNMIANVVSGLMAYTFQEKKPALQSRVAITI
jgi:hypothetical protein